mmetsp:Transcript_968/g.3281  ORF Transcript_968/g.3281 Transcript_968/m.3281 type:complete len:252 (+) Transcript_968:2140-2895(+)
MVQHHHLLLHQGRLRNLHARREEGDPRQDKATTTYFRSFLPISLSERGPERRLLSFLLSFCTRGGRDGRANTTTNNNNHAESRDAFPFPPSVITDYSSSLSPSVLLVRLLFLTFVLVVPSFSIIRITGSLYHRSILPSMTRPTLAAPSPDRLWTSRTSCHSSRPPSYFLSSATHQPKKNNEHFPPARSPTTLARKPLPLDLLLTEPSPSCFLMRAILPAPVSAFAVEQTSLKKKKISVPLAPPLPASTTAA